jgi:uncharacterized membrane protein
VLEKAIYVGGHSLCWDARCAGIYTGFGVGLVWMFLVGRKSKNLPSWPILLLNTLMFTPLFIDLISIWSGLREPSNDIRYLTGILFGGAFSMYLYPAFIALVFQEGRNRPPVNSFTQYGIFLFMNVGIFFVKEMDGVIAYVALSGLSFLGFGGLVVILLAGLVKGIGNLQKG